MQDAAAFACLKCEKRFTIHRRRHHCRSCGKIFCDNCSSHRRTLPAEFGFSTPQRLCRHPSLRTKRCASLVCTPYSNDALRVPGRCPRLWLVATMQWQAPRVGGGQQQRREVQCCAARASMARTRPPEVDCPIRIPSTCGSLHFQAGLARAKPHALVKSALTVNARCAVDVA